MIRTLTRSYTSYSEAQAVVRRLEAADIAGADITIIGTQSDISDASAVEGAGIGGVIGGAAGILAGIGMLAIPGIGPVVAAGWLASTAAGVTLGAVAGSLIGTLVSSGIDEDNAHYYAETLRRGGSVVAVKVDDVHVLQVEAIMDGAGSIDREIRRAIYQKDGWSRFDDKAPPYVNPQL